MSRKRQILLCVFATVAFSLQAQDPPAPPAFILPSLATNLIPPTPQISSPVSFFRELLAMSPSQRNNTLTNRTPQMRARILAKVREYQRLDPDERELRLRATELRWWLTPLLRMPPANRETQLAQVPADLRDLVKSRLDQWDVLPPPMKQEFLDNDHTLHYFARVETTNSVATTPEQQRISEQFNQFFELTTAEKKQTLNVLSPAERAQMEATLKAFDQLPPEQRRQCVQNYAKFAGMSALQRKTFLKNAENWSKMSPQERQTWRDLVDHVPIWPPMPEPAVPANLIPHAAPKFPKPNMATN
jgi:hypothetical protein